MSNARQNQYSWLAAMEQRVTGRAQVSPVTPTPPQAAPISTPPQAAPISLRLPERNLPEQQALPFRPYFNVRPPTPSFEQASASSAAQGTQTDPLPPRQDMGTQGRIIKFLKDFSTDPISTEASSAATQTDHQETQASQTQAILSALVGTQTSRVETQDMGIGTQQMSASSSAATQTFPDANEAATQTDRLRRKIPILDLEDQETQASPDADEAATQTDLRYIADQGTQTDPGFLSRLPWTTAAALAGVAALPLPFIYARVKGALWPDQAAWVERDNNQPPGKNITAVAPDNRKALRIASVATVGGGGGGGGYGGGGGGGYATYEEDQNWLPIVLGAIVLASFVR